MLTLPTTPAQLLSDVIEPALALLPVKFDMPEDDAAIRVQLIAEAAQETSLATRQQDGGPAHGLWQGENGDQSAFALVLRHPIVGPIAQAFCQKRGVVPTHDAVYQAVLTDDILACGFARLDLYCDPHPLPAIGDAQAAWDVYLRTERPGKSRPQDWQLNYSNAVQAVRQS
jgi:hypothetical protein